MLFSQASVFALVQCQVDKIKKNVFEPQTRALQQMRVQVKSLREQVERQEDQIFVLKQQLGQASRTADKESAIRLSLECENKYLQSKLDQSRRKEFKQANDKFEQLLSSSKNGLLQKSTYIQRRLSLYLSQWQSVEQKILLLQQLVFQRVCGRVEGGIQQSRRLRAIEERVERLQSLAREGVQYSHVHDLQRQQLTMERIQSEVNVLSERLQSIEVPFVDSRFKSAEKEVEGLDAFLDYEEEESATDIERLQLTYEETPCLKEEALKLRRFLARLDSLPLEVFIDEEQYIRESQLGSIIFDEEGTMFRGDTIDLRRFEDQGLLKFVTA